MPIRKAKWNTDTQFNYGSPTLTNVSVIGTGNSAYLTLTAKSDNSNNIPFTTPANYTYDNTKIEVAAGIAQLKATVKNTVNYPFTTPANYTYNAGKIEVTGGVSRLVGAVVVPYLWWHLNESSGTSAADSSGNGRVGTTVNMENADWQAGKLNNCLVFDGINEYVTGGNIAGFERTDSFSLECWFKTSQKSCFLISKRNGAPNFEGWSLYIDSVGKIRFELVNVSGGTNQIHVENTTGTWSDNAWHHLIATYDGTSLASGCHLWIDGSDKALTAIFDSLSATILTIAHLNVATRTNGATGFYAGSIDEVVIYEKELSGAEVVARYNSGSGTESSLGAYDTTDPTIETNNGFAFTFPLGTFTETATKPAGSNLKYQLSSDNGVTYKWWNGSSWIARTGGQTDSWYYTNETNDDSTIDTNISSLGASGTLKILTYHHSDTGLERAELDNILVEEGVSYSTGSYEIECNFDIEPTDIFAWLVVTETVTKPANTNIQYKHSENSGSTYNASWLTAAQLQTELQAISLPVKTRIKLLLSTTDASVTPEADNLNITSDAGYETTGSYESTAYQPENNTNGVCLQNITFTKTTPSGTTLIIEARSINNTLEEVAGYQTYSTGDNISLCGDIIQWKASMTTTGQNTPTLSILEIEFHTLIGIWDVLRKVETGRWKMIENQLIYYDDDDITPLYTFNLKDINGNLTMRNIIERVPV